VRARARSGVAGRGQLLPLPPPPPACRVPPPSACRAAASVFHRVSLSLATTQSNPDGGARVVRASGDARAVLHQEHLELLDVVDDELVEARRRAVARRLVRAVANVDQLRQALEPAGIRTGFGARELAVRDRAVRCTRRARMWRAARGEGEPSRRPPAPSEDHARTPGTPGTPGTHAAKRRRKSSACAQKPAAASAAGASANGQLGD
jgi:hypothetical protein